MVGCRASVLAARVLLASQPLLAAHHVFFSCDQAFLKLLSAAEQLNLSSQPSPFLLQHHVFFSSDQAFLKLLSAAEQLNLSSQPSPSCCSTTSSSHRTRPS